jgi:hypothetical protein
LVGALWYPSQIQVFLSFIGLSSGLFLLIGSQHTWHPTPAAKSFLTTDLHIMHLWPMKENCNLFNKKKEKSSCFNKQPIFLLYIY